MRLWGRIHGRAHHPSLGPNCSLGGQGGYGRRLRGHGRCCGPRKERLRLERNRQVALERAASYRAAPKLRSLLQRAPQQG